MPRRLHKLPNVLSKEEVASILKASSNVKHRTMLSLIYACGLRRGELLNLIPTDIEGKRGLLLSVCKKTPIFLLRSFLIAVIFISETQGLASLLLTIKNFASLELEHSEQDTDFKDEL